MQVLINYPLLLKTLLMRYLHSYLFLKVNVECPKFYYNGKRKINFRNQRCDGHL